MTTITPAAGARRAIRQYRDRPTAFLELSRYSSCSELLAAIGRRNDRLERVYLTGPAIAGGTDGWRRWSAQIPAGWSTSGAGHYLEGEHPVLRFEAPDGRQLELLRAAQWFGDGDYSHLVAAAAWDALGAALAVMFPRPHLLSSPAATGRNLYLQTIPRERMVEPLELEHQELIRATSGQGRIELLAGDGAELPELVGYDGRLMYGALCWGLPQGQPRYVLHTDFLGHTRARYHAAITVPSDWRDRCACGAPGHAGLGLLPHAPELERGWRYPSDPGETFAGWYDGAELRIALEHGWHVDPDEALVFDQSSTGTGPLDSWARKLVGTRQRIAARTSRPGPIAPTDQLPPVVGRLAQAGVRSILLHSIGAFHGAHHKVTRSAPISTPEAVPADARDLRHEHDSLVWSESTGPGWPELAHPEWSAAIWARARARLLDGPPVDGRRTGAVHVPAAELLAFRTDAIYLTADPQWPDDGKPGRLRRTVHKAGPLPRPRTHAELLELTQ